VRDFLHETLELQATLAICNEQYELGGQQLVVTSKPKDVRFFDGDRRELSGRQSFALWLKLKACRVSLPSTSPMIQRISLHQEPDDACAV
jgi:hypothetical protein